MAGSKGKGYEDRLQMLGLKTLETRRIRGDLIEVFNILRGIDNVDERLFFSKAISNTRGHDLKLYKHSCRLDCRKYCFHTGWWKFGINCQIPLLHVLQ